MIDESPNLNSADKILEAATKLFAMDSFAAVSIKQISVASGVNSALISYYFGGKNEFISGGFIYRGRKISEAAGQNPSAARVHRLTKLRTYCRRHCRNATAEPL